MQPVNIKGKPMKQPTLAALSIVTKDGCVLLVRRKSEPDAGLWGFPGGHVDYGENVRDAACRELLEETTVKAKAGRILTGLDTIVRSDTGLIEFHFYLVAVQCVYISGQPTGRDDVHEAAWFPNKDVLTRCMPLSEDVDTVLKLALMDETD